MAEKRKGRLKTPSHPGSAAAPPREVPTLGAPPLRTHVTHDDQRLGFVERPYGPLDKTSPPAIVGLRCAQPGFFADSSKHESCLQAPSSDMPGARSLIPASSRPEGRSPKPRCNPS